MVEWEPNEKAGPAKVPEISNSSNIHFPNSKEIVACDKRES
jgi:hypothetical protein